MTKRKAIYDSQRDRENYTFHPTRQFHLIWQEEPGDCVLLALDHRQLSLLREMCAVFPKYHWVWGLSSPRREWDAATQQQWQDINDFVEELEATLLSGCDLQAFIDAQTEQTKAIRQLTAAIIGDNPDLTQPIPDNPDYTTETLDIPGLIPFLRSMLVTQGLLGIYPDMTIADSINAGLIGNQAFELPFPFQGDGIADILDDQADLLNQIMTLVEDHLVMSDSSLFNPIAGEKNLVETIETALRTTSYSDLEPFPNVADVLQQSLKLEDDAFWSNLWRKLGLKPPLPGLNTITQQLAGILAAMSGDVDGKDKIAKAIKEIEMQVNLNNYNGCCDDVDVNCDESQIQTITTEDLDCDPENMIVPVNGNGAG